MSEDRKSSGRRARKRILVVEDDADLREAMCEILESAGYDAVGAEHGEDAIARLEGMAPPSLIVLDLRLPGLDGFGLKRWLDEQPSLERTPVLVVSGHVDITATTRLRLRDAAVLVKPFSAESLIDRVGYYSRS